MTNPDTILSPFDPAVRDFILISGTVQLTAWAGRGHKRTFSYAERWDVEQVTGKNEADDHIESTFVAKFIRREMAEKFVAALGGVIVEVSE